jgi:hypothetical protein
MATITASGASARSETSVAAAKAVAQARATLGAHKPSFGFLFASPEHALGEALKTARAEAGVDLMGCSTAGEFTERGLTRGGVSILLVSSDGVDVTGALARGLAAEPRRVADRLEADAGLQRKDAAARGRHHATTVLFADALAGTCESLVTDLHARARGGSQLVGGAAGDGGRFLRTEVGLGQEADADAAVVYSFLSEKPWGIGVNHGLRSTTKQMRVTRASGNVVFELDGRPAFQAYVEHGASRGVRLTPETATSYMVGNELGIHFFDKIARVRAPLSVGPDGSLRCAAEIPQGSLVSILDGDCDHMIEAARGAATEAKASLDGAAAGVLVFDCVCRGMILKDQFNREIDAVRSVFGEVPVAGFLTYGEIARYQGRLDGWHNATAVVVAIPN